MSDQTNTCGNCRFYKPFHEEPRGECWFNPPSAFNDGGGRRPPVKASDSACGRHQEGAPVVREKRNPETPGLAAKVARDMRRR